MPQLEHIEAIVKRLWIAADNVRANSSYASNESRLCEKLFACRQIFTTVVMVHFSTQSVGHT